MTTKLTSNYPGYSANDIPTTQKFITLRTAQDDPMSWAEFDNNFELLRYSVNSLVDDIAVVREDVDYGAEIAVINENIQSNYSTLDAKFNDYLTSALADTTYLKKTDEIDAYTKTEVDTNFAAKNDLNDYALASSLNDFALASTVNDVVFSAALDDYVTGEALTTYGESFYTKGESDALYAPISSTGSDILTSRGFITDESNSNIEVIASHNVAVLRQAIERALCDPNNVLAEQNFTGVVKLPAGRIYLNEKITITMPGTYGHNLPNSLTIQGEGMGNSQLCWTNSSSSKGMLVELGPYGATISQKVSIRDVDFILGNQGFNSSGDPVGAATSVAEGKLGATGTALHINGNRAEVSALNPHASFTKLQGLGLKPSCLIENCNFMGWNYIEAGWDKCLVIEDSQITDVRSCNFTSHVGGATGQAQWWASTSGIHITGDAKCTDYYLNQNRFFGFKYGILCDGNIEGVTCHQSTWVHSQHGIYWNVQEMVGGQAAFDTATGQFTSGSTDGTPTTNVAQWPLLVVTDCHMNCNENNIYIQNGWQIMIKGCSFYGIDNSAAYGSSQPNITHRSIYIQNKSSNVIINGNTFSDVIGNDDNVLDNGGWGPSIEINGHACLVANNTFSVDPTRVAGAASDEPMVKLGATASANVIHGNMATTNLDPNANQQNGILKTHWNGANLEFTHEDNNPGTTLVANRIQNNF